MSVVETYDNSVSAQSITSAPGASELILQAAERLDSEDPLNLCEGTVTGALYAETPDGFLKMVLQEGGPSVQAVPQPNEDLEQLIRIEPTDPDESVMDIVDSIQYTGGD